MISTLIYKIEKYKILVDDSLVSIPEVIQNQINQNWDLYLKSKPESFNDSLYTIDEINFNNNCLAVIVKKTFYNHYVYSKKNNFLGDYVCRSIAANAILLTSDGYLVFASMSSKTSLANTIKFIGGAFSNDDIFGNNLDAKKCILRELLEETGIDFSKEISSLSEFLFITRKNLSFLNILFLLQTTMSRKEIGNTFSTYKHALENNDAFVEVDNLIFVKNNETELNKILTGEYKYIDYFKEVILIYLKKIQPGNIVDYI